MGENLHELPVGVGHSTVFSQSVSQGLGDFQEIDFILC